MIRFARTPLLAPRARRSSPAPHSGHHTFDRFRGLSSRSSRILRALGPAFPKSNVTSNKASGRYRRGRRSVTADVVPTRFRTAGLLARRNRRFRVHDQSSGWAVRRPPGFSLGGNAPASSNFPRYRATAIASLSPSTGPHAHPAHSAVNEVPKW